MTWVRILPLLSLIPLAADAGQFRAARAANRPADTTKVRDKNWLKEQVRRRYGTTAIPSKTPPKPTPGASDKPAPKKDQPKANNQ